MICIVVDIFSMIHLVRIVLLWRHVKIPIAMLLRREMILMIRILKLRIWITFLMLIWILLIGLMIILMISFLIRLPNEIMLILMIWILILSLMVNM